MLQISRDLFLRWNEKKICYCHWKSNEHLMEGLNGLTDLDVYVAPADKAFAEEALAELQYVKFVPQKGARYPMVDEWLGFDYETGKLVHLHLHFQIITGTKYNKEYVFPIDDLMMHTRVQDSETGVYVISPALELIVLYSRIVLKAKNKRTVRVNEDYKKEILYLKERYDRQQLQQFCKALLGERGDKLFQMIEAPSVNQQEWYDLYKLVDSWLRPYKKYNRLVVRIRYRYFHMRAIRNAVCNRRFHKNYITKKTLPNRGLSVCFIGADGCGKSTVSQEIVKWLSWKVEAKRFYLGSGDHHHSLLKDVLGKAMKRAKSSSAKVTEEKSTHGTEKMPVKKISFKRRILRLGYTILGSTYCKNIAVQAYREIKKASRYTKQGAVALLDRFPQNQFPGLYDGHKVAIRYLRDGKGGLYQRLMAWREERAIEKAQRYQPDLLFKLHLPPEESVRRKPDHTLEEVAAKAAITPKLVFANSKVFDIDATQPYEEELLQIKRLIWNEVLQK